MRDPARSADPACRGSASSCSSSAALLLIQRGATRRRARSARCSMLAVGLAFLIKWAINRGTGSLYAGAIITALAAPDVAGRTSGIEPGRARDALLRDRVPVHRGRAALGRRWGRLAGVVRRTARTARDGQPRASPNLGGLIVPLTLVLLGAALVFGGMFRSRAAHAGWARASRIRAKPGSHRPTARRRLGGVPWARAAKEDGMRSHRRSG